MRQNNRSGKVQKKAFKSSIKCCVSNVVYSIDEKTVKYFSSELKLQDEYLSSIAYSLHQRRHNKIGILKKKTLI